MHEYLDGPILLPKKDNPNAHTGATLPLVMGHEMSGWVMEVGENVRDLTIGQRVTVNPCMGCHHHGGPLCELCQQDRPNICVRSTFYGINAPTGGFADEIVVKHIAVVPLPETISLKAAALAEPLAVAAHMVRISGIKSG